MLYVQYLHAAPLGSISISPHVSTQFIIGVSKNLSL